ncbi:MAG: cohesin domain-containing protein [Anaerolineaceae bacterium]
MKKNYWKHLMLALMVLGSFFFAFKPATAQTGTTVFFSPDPATVYLNGTNSQVVEVWVEDVVNLYGFDFIITYDANLATISSFAMGDLLDIDINSAWCLRKINNPGSFRLLCNLNAPAEPVSDSGVLFTMTFAGKGAGSTPLTFTKSGLVIRDNGNLSWLYPPFTNGALNVAYNSTIKPTTLSGSFDLQGRVDRGGIPVTLSEAQFVGQGPYTVPTTNVSGNNLAFTNVAMDVYTVSTAQAGYLNISPGMGRQIALLASGNVLPPLRLLGGNAIWTNNEIDIFDVALISGEIGKTTFIADADINNDGKVDIFDLAMVAGNFGMTSAIAYAGWLQ